MNFKKRTQEGFSLIELLIVVAIILIIAAIAIPNLLRSKMAANQASAVGSLRTIDTAEVTYSSTYNIGYSANLGDLAPATTPSSTAADLVDAVLAAGEKSGYTFAETGGTAVNNFVNTFGTTAIPQTQGTTGLNSYASNQSGVLWVAVNSATAPAVGDGTADTSSFTPLSQ
jgi:type IV pilus assembly protein PilA